MRAYRKKWSDSLQPTAVAAKRAIHRIAWHEVDIEVRIESAEKCVKLLERWIETAKHDLSRQKHKGGDP